MKYFKYEHWINDNESEWAEKGAEYNAYFEKINDSFTKDFLELYYKEQGFHDRVINKILLTDSNTLSIELTKGKRGFIRIEYKGVKNFNFSNINNVDKAMQIGQRLEWGYDEFVRRSKSELIHSVLTSCGLEFEIDFESINAFYTEQELQIKGTAICI